MKGALPMASSDILGAIERHYSLEAGFVFLREVTIGARMRRADGVAMQLWQSRGIGLHGFEVKVNRADWRRELKQAAKADELYARCLYWWIAAPAGVIDVNEVPDTWGLLEITPHGQSFRMSIARKAPRRTDVEQLDIGTLALLFRRGIEAMKSPYDYQRARELSAEYDRGFKDGREGTESEHMWKESYEEALANIKAFEQASGLNVTHTWPADTARQLGQAVRLVLQSEGYVERIRKDLEAVRDRIDRFISADPPELPRLPTFAEMVAVVEGKEPEAAA